jgi:hypothetical protein
MKDKEDFDRKDNRRKKIKLKNNKKHIDSVDDDFIDNKKLISKDVKKIKETFQDEEWEDWDRYYNH